MPDDVKVEEPTQGSRDGAERRFEAETTAQTTVAQEKREARRAPLGSVVVPGGAKFDLSDFFDGTPNFEIVPNRFLFEPWKMLRNPKLSKYNVNPKTGEKIPEYHYGWAVRDDPFTLAKLRSKRYERVPVSEIDPDVTDAAVSLTSEGTDDGIDYYSLRLYWITDLGWKEGYDKPVQLAALRLARTEEKFNDKITHDGEGRRIPGVEADTESGPNVRR